MSGVDGAVKPPAACGPQQRVPDFFIVGHHKCGTTALWEMLRAHPQIYMPELKEPRFFATDLLYEAPQRRGQSPKTLEEYLSLFDAAGPGQRAGEASPLYLVSHTAAGQIADVQPAARIVAILREPASFLRSLHLQFVQSYLETEKDLRKAISLEQARREGRRVPRSAQVRPQMLVYSEHVRYVEQLRRYHAVFSPGQVLVLIYDDFRKDNEATVRMVLRFLEVDDTAPIVASQVNPTVRTRSQRLGVMVHAVSVGGGPTSRAVKTTVKALAPRRLRRRALSATQRRVLWSNPPPLDESLMTDLRRRFKGEVVALSEYLNRDLVTLWGYEDVE